MSAQLNGSDKDSYLSPEMPENNTPPLPLSNNVSNAEETTDIKTVTNTNTGDKGNFTSRQQQQDESKKRPYMPKFATIHTDKYSQNLRREFPMTNFDRNLTVEKARFDPQPNEHKEIPSSQQPISSSSPPQLLINNDLQQQTQQQQQLHHPPRPSSPPTVTPNSITPSVSSNGIHTPSSTFSVTNTKPTRQPAKSKSEVKNK